jgi:hypothetical protein
LRIHFVWSAKSREPLISPPWADRLHGYLGTVLSHAADFDPRYVFE